MNPIKIKRISGEDIESLSQVYKDVFSGYPWYEERICSGSLEKGQNTCNVQYTSKKIPSDYLWSLNRERRAGVVGDSSGLEKCIICDREIIEFYPAFVNQKSLIEESLQKQGFIGYLLGETGERAFGFSWGYEVPRKSRTASVNFPLIVPFLESYGLNIEKTFYWAELGIVEEKQSQGLGYVASAAWLLEVKKSDYQFFVLRTKNERVLKIAYKLFSCISGEKMFDDPERESPWYKWDFEKFDVAKASSLIESMEIR